MSAYLELRGTHLKKSILYLILLSKLWFPSGFILCELYINSLNISIEGWCNLMKFKEVPNIKRHIDTYLANFRNCVVNRKLPVVVNRVERFEKSYKPYYI